MDEQEVVVPLSEEDFATQRPRPEDLLTAERWALLEPFLAGMQEEEEAQNQDYAKRRKEYFPPRAKLETAIACLASDEPVSQRRGPWTVSDYKEWRAWWTKLYEEKLWTRMWPLFLSTLDPEGLFRWSVAVGPRNEQHNHRFAPHHTRVRHSEPWWFVQAYRSTYLMRLQFAMRSEAFGSFEKIAGTLGTRLTPAEALGMEAVRAVSEFLRERDGFGEI